MTDFFISYTSADKQWAEWIGFVLEEERYSVILQAWDFRPGNNFILEMQNAAKTAERTVMVLSPDYLKSQFTNPEWSAAFAKDPQGLMRKVVPVIVRDCAPDGLLGQIVHINLVDLDAKAAREELVNGVRAGRAKPSSRPGFPGASATPADGGFPGASSTPAKTTAMPYMPKVKRAASDMEKRRFLKSSFEAVMSYFETALAELARRIAGLDYDFQPVTAMEFTAEVFVQGKSSAFCRIRYGSGTFSQNGISFSEGQHHSSDSVNEVLNVSDDAGEIWLSSMMGGLGYGNRMPEIDSKHMTPDQASEYLWRRFIYRLEA